VFIVAHRLSTVRHCDKIVVLDEGNIAEAGTHAELIDRNGYYARLHGYQSHSPVIRSLGSPLGNTVASPSSGAGLDL